MAPLHELGDLNLRFEYRNVVGYILSHLFFPESAQVNAEASYNVRSPHPSYPTPLHGNFPVSSKNKIRHHRHERRVVQLDRRQFPLGYDTPLSNPDTAPVRFQGGGYFRLLGCKIWLTPELPLGMWRELLYWFPRLEKIPHPCSSSASGDSADPF
jgi:hypothetical protein